jgi:hypothetical protein
VAQGLAEFRHIIQNRDMSTRASWFGAIALCFSAIGGCTGSACENKVVYGAPSPDGAFIAFIFHRTCGPNNALSTQITLIGFHDSLRGDAGNVLAVNDDQPVKVSWRSPTLLVVTGFHNPTFESGGQIGAVTIEFR